MAEPLRPEVEHVAGEDGKHRGRSAEQHREQIEADRAEHQPIDPNVAQSFDHLPPGSSGRVESACLAPVRSRAGGEGEGEEQPAGGVRRIRRKGIEVAAESRAEHRAGLPRDRGKGDRSREDVARDQVRGERAECRPGERAANAEQCGDDIERLERGRRLHASQPSAAAQPSSSATAPRAIQRRSSRSAIQPVTRVRRNKGTNWTSPIIPRRSAASFTPIVCRAMS